MRNLFNFLWTGFGTGVTALRAVGLAIITILGVFFIAYYVIRWMVRLFQKKSDTPS